MLVKDLILFVCIGIFRDLFLFYVYVCFAWVYAYALHARWWRRPEEGFESGSSGIRVTDGCEPLCGYQELNLGPLEEHQCSNH